MGNWLFSRPKDHQSEKIFHDVFVNGCFGGTFCAKNFRSSELWRYRARRLGSVYHAKDVETHAGEAASI
jgi:hypothetical protein